MPDCTSCHRGGLHRGRYWLTEYPVEGLQQVPHPDGLSEVVSCTSREELAGLGLGRVGAEDDDGDIAGSRVGAELVHRVLAWHVRQMQVQQNQIRVVLAGQVEGRCLSTCSTSRRFSTMSST